MRKVFPTILIVFYLGLFIQEVSGQNPLTNDHRQATKDRSKSFRIAFYNVENLFDTIDDPITDDADFLPGARIPWTAARYELKLNHLAQVIHDLSAERPVAVFGLCEIENKMVLDELVKSPQIIPYRYQVIHRESPDERGIDNAMLYDASQFDPISVLSIPVMLPSQTEDRTRDILYVKGISKKAKGDTLHLFVNHWPSRSEGKEVSEPKRIAAAKTLKHVTDSLFMRNPNVLIVIMGDFNDEPSDKSLTEGLKALAPVGKPVSKELYNLMYPLFSAGKGTLYYKDWDLFDQVIISGSFWNKSKGFMFAGKEGKIFEAEYLFYKSNDGTLRPNRTAAKDYYGGYSDHLPVYLDLKIKQFLTHR